MPSYFAEIWENLVARISGPMHWRIFIEPALSICYAFYAAAQNAKSQYPPYLWRFLATTRQRRAIARENWKDTGKLFILAASLDLGYQLILIIGFDVKENFNPAESLMVALLLAIIPYILVRGPVKRIIAKRYAKRHKGIYDISKKPRRIT